MQALGHHLLRRSKMQRVHQRKEDPEAVMQISQIRAVVVEKHYVGQDPHHEL